MMKGITTRVERNGEKFALVITEQQMRALSLHENDMFEIEALEDKLELTPSAHLPRHVEAYRRTRAENAGVYAELAK